MSSNDITEIFTKSNINNAEDYLKNLEVEEKTNSAKKSSSTDNYFQYTIDKCLKTNFHEIKIKEGSHINFCCLRIIENTKYSQVLYPYLQYLLFKYPNSDDKESNLCIFPFKEYKKNMNILGEGKIVVKKIFNKQYNCIGYTLYDDEVYLFYNIDYKKSTEQFVKKKNEKFWWTLIDEICNHKKILNFPIHSSVYNLFYNKPSLIHLKNRKGHYIETPVALYNGEYFNKLPYLYIIGLKSSTNALFGPFYYFTDYLGAFRRGGWSSNYKMIKINNKLITDEDGMYKKGGIIRYSVFLGKSRVILNNKNDHYHKTIINDNTKKKKSVIGKWAQKYDSVLGSKLKIDSEIYYNQTHYIVTKNLENINALTIHEIDMQSLKANWDPQYTGYSIF